jgi:hypothetical protein
MSPFKLVINLRVGAVREDREVHLTLSAAELAGLELFNNQT